MHNQLDEIQWAKVIAEAWINPDFKASLQRDPTSTVRDFARAQFGIDIDPEIDSFDLPEAPTDMFGEELSASGTAGCCVTGSATAAGNAQCCVTGSATAAGNAQCCVTGSATAAGNATSGKSARCCVTGSATAAGNIQ